MLSRQLPVSKPLLIALLLVAVQCLCVPAAWSRELKMSIEPSFTSGKYGTDSTTDTFEVPLKLRYTGECQDSCRPGFITRVALSTSGFWHVRQA